MKNSEFIKPGDIKDPDVREWIFNFMVMVNTAGEMLKTLGLLNDYLEMLKKDHPKTCLYFIDLMTHRPLELGGDFFK